MKFNKGMPLNDALNAVRVEVIAENAENSTQQRTPAFLNVTNSGTIAAGSQSVAIANIGNAAGVVLGTNLPAGAGVSWAANGSDTLGAIAYNATGTNFLITTVG